MDLRWLHEILRSLAYWVQVNSPLYLMFPPSALSRVHHHKREQLPAPFYGYVEGVITERSHPELHCHIHIQPLWWIEDVIVHFSFLLLCPGLARKEDFPYITYYCPHCHALNGPQNSELPVSGTTSPEMDSLRADGGGNSVGESPKETIATSSSAMTESETLEATKKAAVEESVAS